MVHATRGRLDGRMKIIYVVSDCHSRYSKPCRAARADASSPCRPTAVCCPARRRMLYRFLVVSVYGDPLAWI